MQPRTGTLNLEKEELENHLVESYLDVLRNVLFSEIDGLANDKYK